MIIRKDKFFRISFLLVTIAFCPTNVYGQGAGNTAARTIERLYQVADGKLAIYADGGSWANPALCDSSNRAILESGHARRDEFYAAILAALMSGREIKLWLANECATWNGVSYPKVSGLHSY